MIRKSLFSVILVLSVVTLAATSHQTVVADFEPLWCQDGEYYVADSTHRFQEIETGDMDNDGDLDVIALTKGEKLYIYWNDSTGTLDSSTSLTGGAGVWSVRLADLDSSGYLDIVVSDDIGRAFYIYRSDSGSFSEIDTTEFPTRITGLEVGDFNGDWYPDIVVGSDCAQSTCLRDTVDTNAYDDSIYVYLNDGSGGFDDPVPYSHGLGLLDQLAAADIDLDGDLDLVASEGDNQTEVGVIENLGDTAFAAADQYVVGGIPYGIELIDYDDDGFPDLVISLFNDHAVGLLMNKDDSTAAFDTEVTTSEPPYFAHPTQIAVGDIDGDGNPDIASSSNYGYGMVWTIEGTGSSAGVLGDESPVIPDTLDITGFSVALADLDDDGYMEVIAGNENRLLVFTNCECGIPNPGDVNASGLITSADVIYLNSHILGGGPDPLPCDAAGDVNCSGSLTSGDVISLNSYVINGTPVPCDVCSNVVPDPFTCE